MPSPPRQGETQEAFISRCHEALASEYKDPAQRHAVCMSYWRRSKTKKSLEDLTKQIDKRR